MNKKNFFIVFIAAIAIVVTFIAATAPDDASFIEHKIAKGESVSLLCIEIYGYYSKELGSAFAEDNPSVKDINLIYVGQTIRFRKPVTAAEKPEEKADSVFYKKVAATQGVVTYVEGHAEIIKHGNNEKEKLSSNVVVHPDDVIKTGKNGRVELIINRESVVRMKENTELTIEAFRDPKQPEGKTSVNFSVGTVWAKVKKFKDKISRFELELPTAIAGVHGTIYQTTVNSDSSAEVKVYDGEVAVSGRPQNVSAAGAPQEVSGPSEVQGPHEVSIDRWTSIVRSMQSIKIDNKGVPTEALPFKKAPDDSWEKWNEERDIRIAKLFMEI
ncbi:FecR domain-containing protein [candidate division KSB1 bacterium]|nr:FecR domain-containing protein [candidate division KSB1 bacterium]